MKARGAARSIPTGCAAGALQDHRGGTGIRAEESMRGSRVKALRREFFALHGRSAEGLLVILRRSRRMGRCPRAKIPGTDQIKVAPVAVDHDVDQAKSPEAYPRSCWMRWARATAASTRPANCRRSAAKCRLRRREQIPSGKCSCGRSSASGSTSRVNGGNGRKTIGSAPRWLTRHILLKRAARRNRRCLESGREPEHEVRG